MFISGKFYPTFFFEIKHFQLILQPNRNLYHELFSFTAAPLMSAFFSDIFTLISDSSGHMIRSRFDDYLRDLLLLPAAVYEGTSFRYSEEASRTFFDSVSFDFKFFM